MKKLIIMALVCLSGATYSQITVNLNLPQQQIIVANPGITSVHGNFIINNNLQNIYIQQPRPNYFIQLPVVPDTRYILNQPYRQVDLFEQRILNYPNHATTNRLVN
jgi:hypothetical protein